MTGGETNWNLTGPVRRGAQKYTALAEQVNQKCGSYLILGDVER
jgi:hypothetical protein